MCLQMDLIHVVNHKVSLTTITPTTLFKKCILHAEIDSINCYPDYILYCILMAPMCNSCHMMDNNNCIQVVESVRRIILIDQ